MNDLERELRNALDREAGDAPAPHDAGAAVRRTRRRQVGMIAGSVIAAAALIAIAVVGFGALSGESGEVVPASTTEEMNGIRITFPDRWTLIDPDVAGLNGSDPGNPDPLPQLPRIVLALAPFDPGQLFGCPGMAEGDSPTFLMTIQEEPRALTGDGARLWPVELEPLDVGTDESACYPGWEFLHAGWTAEGRTFEARVGFSPDVTDADRDALFRAFATMTFSPGKSGPAAAVLETGEIGGETWQLIASRDDSGLSLSVETDDMGSGIHGFTPESTELQFAEIVVGGGPGARTLVFGAVPPGTAAIDCPHATAVRTFDVPDEIDDRFEAFIVVLDVGREAELNAVDADGNVIASGRTGSDRGEPVESPSDEPASDEPALEDGRHYGFVRAVHPTQGTIEFDLAYFLTGEEANRAYQEATGETGPVPNDYYVVNENPRLRELTFADDLRLRLLDWTDCCDTFFDGEIGPFAKAIEEQTDVLVDDVRGKDDVIYRGLSSWWITIEDGVVVEIEEQYTP
ncbi:MAG TPA: hypothetical protein VFA08_06735 [Actinomycetota bacterium]|jgi:hypothetical protein|nr:hypothetical protein [Actinomycetota bacterium]